MVEYPEETLILNYLLFLETTGVNLKVIDGRNSVLDNEDFFFPLRIRFLLFTTRINNFSVSHNNKIKYKN